MQNTTADGVLSQWCDPDEMRRAIVADLASVIEHARQSLKLIEQAVASEAAAEEVVADNVVVLDDVTPAYARADAALRECDAGLSLALCLLLGPSVPDEGDPPRAHWLIST